MQNVFMKRFYVYYTSVNIYLLKYIVEANNFYYVYLPLMMNLNTKFKQYRVELIKI